MYLSHYGKMAYESLLTCDLVTAKLGTIKRFALFCWAQQGFFQPTMYLPLSVEQREIGKTGIKVAPVAPVGLGCMSLVSRVRQII